MNKSTNNENTNAKSFQVESRNGYTRFIKPAVYTVWTLLGLLIIVLLSVAVFGSGTWEENLNIREPASSEEAVVPEPQQPAQQPQQPTEPTEEQLACISDQIGEERLGELLEGSDVEDQEESAIIEACLLEQ